jgi:hypothetical protein
MNQTLQLKDILMSVEIVKKKAETAAILVSLGLPPEKACKIAGIPL